MVQELRRIILTKQELFSALECHRRMTPQFLPEGKIVDFETINETSMMITVETDPSVQEASVFFPDDKLIQALIRFCLENNIMLPLQGRKSVLVAQDNVSLCIDLDLDTYIGRPGSPSEALA